MSFNSGENEESLGNRGVNVRPNSQTWHKPDTGFCGLGLGLSGFES